MLANHKDLKDVNLESVRMLLLDDGANPCEYFSLCSIQYILCVVYKIFIDSVCVFSLQGHWPPVICFMMHTAPRDWQEKLCVLVLALQKHSLSLSGGAMLLRVE